MVQSPRRDTRISSLRRILVAAALALAVLLLLQQFGRLLVDRSRMTPDDFVEYWAAGRLNLRGLNPYDADNLFPLEQDAGRQSFPLDSSGRESAIMMWNPPWTLTVAMPLGWLDARLGQLIWLLLNLAVILFCADWTWTYYHGRSTYRWLPLALMLTFIPTTLVLRAGQIGPLILLGVVGFLHFEKQGRLLLAGAACVLIAIKPHLLFLFWIALMLWALGAWTDARAQAARARSRVLTGGMLTGLVATIVPILFNPEVCQQYWFAVTRHPPEEWVSLTIGAILRLLFGAGLLWLQLVPAIPALIWFGFHWRKHHANWAWGEQMPLLVLVSFLTTFYGAWPFDLVILLLPVIQVAVWAVEVKSLRMTALVMYLAIDLTAVILNAAKVTSIWFIWMTPTILACYLSLRADRSIDETSGVIRTTQLPSR